MTLLIACLLIHGFGMGSGWYWFAGFVWVLHLMAHSDSKR